MRFASDDTGGLVGQHDYPVLKRDRIGPSDLLTFFSRSTACISSFLF